MKLLFEIDKKDYDLCKNILYRPSSRAIIIKKDKIALVHSLKLNYYKFPGGGIKENESNIEALIRETLEETGLTIIPSSIREYGYVHRIQRSEKDPNFIFDQDNYYYLCQTEEKTDFQNLDNYEQEEQFTLEFVHPETAVKINRSQKFDAFYSGMIERETLVLERLIHEGYFK